MRPLVLAIDAGTTGVRALVFDGESVEHGGAYEELAISYPRPGWVECDAAAVWRATRRVVEGAVGRAREALGEVRLAAVGVANQRATTVLWERRSGQALHPAIVWQDTRTAGRVTELLDRGVFASTMASATKLEWLLRTVPGAAERARRGELCFGTIDSWLVWNLTGGEVHMTDSSNASCTGLYDFVADAWDGGALDMLEIPPSLLPRLAPSSAVYGETSVATCGFTAPVAAVAGDQQAAMFGQLRLSPGDVKITFGTSAMADINTGAQLLPPARGTYPLVLSAVRGQRVFCLEGTAITAGAAVQWLRDGLGIIADAAESAGLAEQVTDPGGAWAVPAFQGLGTPHMDPRARAVIGGLSRGTSRAHLVHAVLEGIAFRCTEVVETLLGAAGQPMPAELRADGGAAANDFLMQALADVLDVPVERPATVQATALGAAYLAGLAAGVWIGIEDLRQAWRLGRRFEPGERREQRRRRLLDWRAHLALSRGAGCD